MKPILAIAAMLLLQPEPLTPARMELMKHNSWRAGCPVPLTDLRLLKLPYWDFTGQRREGELIVNRAVAEEVEQIFRELYRHSFRIEKMQPVDDYGGNDDRSMEANNTSAFNCREKTGQPGTFSNHSWGRAVDINPLTNPYVKGTTVLPAAGRQYLDRSKHYVGGIEANGFVVKLFEKHGWTWGGRWKDRQDFQHFEKPASQ